MPPLTSSCLIQRAAKLLETRVDNETIVMDPASGMIYAMAATGQAIWDQLAEPRRLPDLVGSLVERFDVDEDVCAREVGRFVDDLRKLGFVDVASPSA